MNSFTDIVDKTIKDAEGYVFQKIRLYDRGDSDIILIVETITAPKGIKFDMTTELTAAEAVALAGGLLMAAQKVKARA